MSYEHEQTLAMPQPEFDLVISAPPPEQPQRNIFGLIARPADAEADAPPGVRPAGEGGGSGPTPILRPRNRRKRSVPLDWMALVLAFLVPPVGLVTGIAALIAGSRREGWASPVAAAATSIALVLSLACTAAFVVFADLARDEQAHAGIVESSRDLCAALAASPGVLESDTFGWPAPQSTVAESLAAMIEYEAFWLGVVDVAPEGVRAEATRITTAVRSIIDEVELARIMNPASDRELMRALAGDSRIPAWVEQYCE